MYKPAEFKVDPFTLDLIKPEAIYYTEKELTPNNFYNFLIRNMPDFTRPIHSILQFQELRDGILNLDINKVIIISNKQNVTPEFKAIASEYRDRILIGFAPVDALEVHSEFADFVTKKPEVIVYKSFESDSNKTLEIGERIMLNETGITVPLLKAFLEQYALKERKQSLLPRKRNPYIELFTYSQFNKDILENEKSCIVFFTESPFPIEK